MKQHYLITFGIILSLFLIGVVSAVDVSSCGTLSADTYYEMTGDITAPNESSCMFINNGDNTVLDCNGYSIIGNTTATVNKYAIYLNKNNVTIRNCVFENWNHTDNFVIYSQGSNLNLINTTLNNSNWSATDTYSTGISCNLTIDSIINQSDVESTSGVSMNVTVDGFSEGSHYWNATCWDNISLVSTTSETYNFLVDTVYPAINFTSPTTEEGIQAQNWIYANVTASDTNNISTFVDLDGSLVSWWRMDDVSGSTVVDYMGRNNGTAQGDAKQTDAGYFGKGFEFDGSGDYVEIGESNNFITSDNFTITSWFKADSIGSGNNDNRIITFMRTSGASTGLSLLLGLNDNVRLLYVDEEGTYRYIEADESVSLGEWYNFIMTYNGTTFVTYINGANPQSAVDGFQGISTGTAYVGAFSSGQYFFNGTIDDVMIFNRSLSDVEIQALYANTSSKYLEVNYTGLTDGNHTIKAYTQDIAGNVNSTEERSIYLDFEDVSGCRELSQANQVYTLQNDLETTGTCFNITADNVTLDGNGKTIIYGNDSSTTTYSGVEAYGRNNITINNLIIQRGSLPTSTRNRYGIYFVGTNNSLIKNINASVNRYGIYLSSSSNNNILENITANSNTYGIYLYSSSNNNLSDITANSNFKNGIYLQLDSNNNTLINVTWTGTESVDVSSSYTRKWWVKGTSNLYNTLIRISNTTQDINSYYSQNAENIAIIEYINNGGTKTNYTDYTLTASKTGYTTQTYNFNLTNNLEYNFMFDATFDYLVSWLRLNENEGTVLHDSSGNGNVGEIKWVVSAPTWNNDGILVTLTRGVDYTINTLTGVFTVINNDYLYNYNISSWTYDTSGNVALEGESLMGSNTSIVGIILTISLLAVVLYILINLFMKNRTRI